MSALGQKRTSRRSLNYFVGAGEELRRHHPKSRPDRLSCSRFLRSRPWPNPFKGTDQSQKSEGTGSNPNVGRELDTKRASRCRGLPKTPNAIPRKRITLNANACGQTSPIQSWPKRATKDAPSARRTQWSGEITRSLLDRHRNSTSRPQPSFFWSCLVFGG